jgi:curved DNA-binding protein
MQNFRNYYEILGVSRDTEAAEIKRAYRQLARQYHPDVNQGNAEAENKFKEMNEAYEVLSDPERRGQYDKFGSFWKQQGFQNGQKRPWAWNGSRDQAAPPEPEDDLDFAGVRDFNSFVDELLTRRAPKKDTWMDTPRETPRDRPREMSSEMPRERPDRSASSARSAVEEPAQSDDWSNTEPKRRDDSWGASWGGSEPIRTPPPRDEVRRDEARRDEPRESKPQPRDAEANLTVPLEKAYTGGQERIRLEDGRMIEVKLPTGMVSGQRVRLKGQGVAGGDLYLRIEVAVHKFFRLNGVDVVTQIPITPTEAVLGGAIEVPTLDGLVKMNLPTAVRSGQKLRLAKKGYPSPETSERGDQIVELLIQMPKSLSDAERQLYEQLRTIETNPRQNLT